MSSLIDCTAVVIPKMAIAKNAQRIPNASDKNPMMGGPIKKPKKPTEDTEANAVLACPCAANGNPRRQRLC